MRPSQITVFVSMCAMLCMLFTCNKAQTIDDNKTATEETEVGKGTINKANLILQADLPPNVPSLPVYRVLHTDFDKAWLQDYARIHFGLLDDAKQIGRSLLIIDNGIFDVHVNTLNGGVEYKNKTNMILTQPSIRLDLKQFPPKQKCKEIAENFLRERNLMEKDAYYFAIGDDISVNKAITVLFVRKINNILVWGAGAKIIVDVGVDGSVVSFHKMWQSIESVGSRPLITSETALNKLWSGEADFYEDSKGVIYNMQIAYRSLPIAQQYLQPYYLFTCRDKNDVDDRFEIYVSALQQPLSESDQ